ncbi:ATP-binding protein [Leptospira idonii]|uniref:histidine kinase n=1 Tax=Leptospira idonii TaxID=1193500 RepID=A0A4R9M003_9LEPT|nr:ATP-binding protein [Leptospira idonii]TGN19970.1 response regulator [Leptospira idonii]
MAWWIFSNRGFIYKSVLSVILILFIILSGFDIWKIIDAKKYERETLVKLGWSRGLEEYLSSLTDAETGQRGYLISEDESFLEPYYNAEKSFPGMEVALVSQVEPKYKGALESIIRLANDKRSHLQQIISLAQSGKKQQAILLIKTKRGKTLMDQIRKEVGLVLSEKNRIETEERREQDRTNIILFSVSVFGFFCIAILILWTIYLISQNNKMEQEKKELTVKYLEVDDLYNNSPVAFHSLDGDGSFLKLNDTEAKWLGYKKEELIGKKKFPEILTEESKMTFYREFPAFKRRGYVNDLRFEIIKKDGSTIHIVLSSTAIYDEKGNILMTRSSFVDITKLVLSERELIHARKKAEEANLAKSEFLSGMSHELRTPLNAVIGLTMILMEENPKPDQIENLNNLKFSSETLLALINDILDFSKIEERKIILESISFRLDTLLQSIFFSFEQKAKEKMIRFRSEIAPNFPQVVKSDPTRLLQILNNLLSNAVKFTQQGEISFEAKLLYEKDSTLFIQFIVTDTGIGIPDDKIHTVFEKFTQVSGDTTRKYGGSGLGLAISKGLVELMQGHLVMSTKLDEGTSFSVILPMEKSNEVISAESVQDKGSYSLLVGKTIIVADDIAINRDIVVRFLKKWGVQCIHAVNGEEVLKYLAVEKVDLILMDLHMPELDGYQTTKKIREGETGEELRQLPIIALTASAQLETQEKIKTVGMNDYIAKPFLPKELYLKLIYHLERGD